MLPPWQELEDAQGNPYFYNHHTRDSSRRHPLDSQFLKLVTTVRHMRASEHRRRAGGRVHTPSRVPHPWRRWATVDETQSLYPQYPTLANRSHSRRP